MLDILRQAQEDTCSLHCPTTRKADEEWIHSERCNAVSAAITKVESALNAAYSALRSYQYGNSAPDLAERIADHVSALLFPSEERG